MMQTVQLGKGWFPEESGGLNRYFRGLAEHLPDEGVEVAGMVAGSRDVVTHSHGLVESFAGRHMALPFRLARARSCTRRTLRRHPTALVVSHFALYTAPSLDLLRNSPLVVHFHGPWAAESAVEGSRSLATGLKRRMESAVYSRADRLVVLSEAFAEVLATQYSVAPDRIRVIGGGVDTAAFTPTSTRTAARIRLRWPTDRPIALVVRRLVHRMGLENLIEAVAMVRRAVPDVLVMIAGSGPLAGELAHRIVDRDLHENIRLLGFVPDADLPAAYRAADLSVVPSEALEGFGLVVAESLAAGTPVLVTDVGGLPETIRELAPDWIVTERTAGGLSRSLTAALSGELPAPSEAACRDHARSRFDWSVVARKVERVYAEAMQ